MASTGFRGAGPAAASEDDAEYIEELPRISPLSSPSEYGMSAGMFDLPSGFAGAAGASSAPMFGQGLAAGSSSSSSSSSAAAAAASAAASASVWGGAETSRMAMVTAGGGVVDGNDEWAAPLTPGTYGHTFGKHMQSQPLAIPRRGSPTFADGQTYQAHSATAGGSLFDVPMGASPPRSAYLALPSPHSKSDDEEDSFLSATAGGLFEPPNSSHWGGQHQHQPQGQPQLPQFGSQHHPHHPQHFKLEPGASYPQSSTAFGSLFDPLHPAALGPLAGASIPRPNDQHNGTDLWRRRVMEDEQQRYAAQRAAGHPTSSASAIVSYNPDLAAAAANIKLDPDAAARGYGGGGGSGGAAAKLKSGGRRAGARAAGAAATVSATPEWDGKLPERFDQLTDKQLTYIAQPDLRRLVEKAQLDDEEIQQMKIKRRKLKNRQSAKTAVGKKKIQFQGLAKSNIVLSATVEDLETKNTQLKDQNERQKQELNDALRARAACEAEIKRLTALVTAMSGKYAGVGPATPALPGAGAGNSA